MSQLARILVLILVSFFIAGCGASKNNAIYSALPINTDGNPSGKVILVEFLDYSNLDCLKMASIINVVMEKRPNVRIIYHPMVDDAQKAYFTRLVLAAGLQDRFLAANHLMVNASPKLTEQQAIDLLSQAFIDTNELKRQEMGPEVSVLLSRNEQLAKQNGVTHLPTFFVGKMGYKAHPLMGAQTLTELLAAIDKENAE
ncbi:MAG: thioredoxin domain-containing protein [Gammaproteobacteria bacterium]|nr:thioredoxin domain-containing protein [Gammaproteobacteria bacterium]